MTKSFDDIKFDKHPLLNGAIRGQLELGNGIALSVVAGESLYSGGKYGNRGPVTKLEDATTFEVAVMNDGEIVDDVLGWQSKKDINQLIQILG